MEFQSLPEGLLRTKETCMECIGLVDVASARAILEDRDSSDHEVAVEWVSSVVATLEVIARSGSVPVYRHMLVEDFDAFVSSLRSGAGSLGIHWSINPDIRSPTWKQDQRGEVPVYIEGTVSADSVNWEETLRQQCEWPHEGELIFHGDVAVCRIENQDTDEEISPAACFRR